MFKKIIYIVSMSVAIAPVLVFAQETAVPEKTGVRSELQEKREALRQGAQEKRDALKQDLKEKKDSLKQEFVDKKEQLKDKVDGTRSETKDKREVVRTEMQEKREALKKEMQEKKEGMKKEIEAKREQFKVSAQERRDALKKKLGEKRAENIEKFFMNMSEKFHAAIGRLNTFADKIEDRLDKAEDNGKDVSVARTKLADAQSRIAATERSLADAKTGYKEMVKDSDPKAAFAKVKEAVGSVAANVREAHKLLVEVVTSLKGLGSGIETAPVTTTPTQ